MIGVLYRKKSPHWGEYQFLSRLKSQVSLARYYEVKLNTRKYNEAKLKLNAEAFLEVNPKLKEYKLSIKGLSLENV